MAKGAYIGVDGVARKVKKGYVGVSDSYTILDYIQSSGTQYIDRASCRIRIHELYAPRTWRNKIQQLGYLEREMVQVRPLLDF